MSKTFSPLRYPGGKSQFYDSVLKIMRHNGVNQPIYIEPFAGGAGVAMRLLIEGHVSKVVINDIDYAIYSFWHTVLFDTDWLIEKINKVNVCIDEWYVQKEIYNNQNKYAMNQVGFATLFLNRCNRSGIITAGPIGGKKQKGNYKIDCRFNKKSIIELIRTISLHKNRISLFNDDALCFIKHYKPSKESFWFIDPPYYVKGKELYKNAFNNVDHETLSSIIKSELNKDTWILTYDVCSEIYDLYCDYPHKTISLSYSVERKRKEHEYLFYNNLIEMEGF